MIAQRQTICGQYREDEPRLQQLKLSERLTAIANSVTLHERVCDVGCDHAHIPIRLLNDGVVESALAMDVIPGPLKKASENLALYSCSDKVELRQSDGLDAYVPGEAQTLVIAGMGGRIMSRILTREPEKSRNFGEWILQPQADPDHVRSAIRTLGWYIDAEKLIFEDGKYYPVIHAVPDPIVSPSVDWPFPMPVAVAREVEDMFGPVLLKRKDSTLLQFIRWQLGVTDRILEGISRASESDAAQARRKEVEHTYSLLKYALAYYTDKIL